MAQKINCSVECVLDVRNAVRESPVWSARERALYRVGIHPRNESQRIQDAIGIIHRF